MSMLFPNDLFDLAAELRRTAAEAPDRVAVMAPYRSNGQWQFRTWNYAQLSQDTDTASAALHHHGFREGTRTVIMAPPSYESLVIQAALSQLGIVALWIDPSVGYFNVAERLSRIKPEAFVGIPLALAGRSFFGWGPRLLKKTVVVDGIFPGALSFRKLTSFGKKRQAVPNVQPDSPCNVFYTTGSTGPAKPALYNQRQFCNVIRTAHYSWRFHEYPEPPRDMAGFPAFGMIPVAAGGTLVIPPINFARWRPATTPGKEVCEVIEAAQVRSLFASPAFLERIAVYAKAQPVSPLRSVRRIIGGGAPLFAPLVRDLLSVISPEGDVVGNYGATEALPSTEMGGHELLQEVAHRIDAGEGMCVGYPFPGVEIRAVTPIDGKSVKLSDYTNVTQGETGELIVCGPNIGTEYFMDAESTAKNKLYADDGTTWHRLGDVGHLDEKGRAWVAGRVSQCIQIGNERLLPISIEAMFDKHPQVRRSGLAARNNPQGSREAVVAIEPVKGLNSRQKAQLKSAMETLLKQEPALQRVSAVVLLDALPLDPRHNAKIERGKLSAMIQKLSA